MGRLENFIPVLKRGCVSGDESNLKLVSPRGNPIALDSTTAAFVRQINGHLSLKEIFLFLNSKGESFSIKNCLNLLSEMGEEGLLHNEEDYYRINSKNDRSRDSQKWDSSHFSQERMISLLQKTTLFMKCDREAAVNILKNSELVHLADSVKLLSEGTKSSHFYVLLAGEVGIFRSGECLAHLGSLSVFGESAAIFNQTRNADVITTQESWLLQIDASELVDRNSPESFEVFKGLRSRLILNHTLSATPLFAKVPSDIMQFFISKCRIEKYTREHVIIEQDESGGDFYFILQGSVSVVKSGMPVTSLSEGNHFGEVAALFDLPRTATIITESDCTFLVLSQKRLFEVLSSHFRLAIDIEKIAEKRRDSKSTLLELFDDAKSFQNKELDDLSLVNTNPALFADASFIETSQTHFHLEVVDFSNSGSGEAC